MKIEGCQKDVPTLVEPASKKKILNVLCTKIMQLKSCHLNFFFLKYELVLAKKLNVRLFCVCGYLIELIKFPL